jgi:hypothetical protein
METKYKIIYWIWANICIYFWVCIPFIPFLILSPQEMNYKSWIALGVSFFVGCVFSAAGWRFAKDIYNQVKK